MSGLETFEYAVDKELTGYKSGDLVVCEIDAKHLTTDNIGIKERRVWGTDDYTDNSDLVALAAHAGVVNPTAEVPKFSGMVMVVRLMDALDVYTSSSRNNLRSRSLTALREKLEVGAQVAGRDCLRFCDQPAFSWRETPASPAHRQGPAPASAPGGWPCRLHRPCCT